MAGTETSNPIGFCLLMLSTDADPLAQSAVAQVRAAGYDYAEIPFAKLDASSDSEIHSYRSQLQQEGLQVAAFNNGMSVNYRLLGQGAVEQNWRAYAQRVMELADFFGISMITSCAPYRSCVTESFSWEHYGRAQYAEFLRFMDETCEKHHVKYAIEPIFRGENSFVATVKEAADVLALAKSCRNIGICPDYFHMRMEHDDPGALVDLIAKGKIFHIHYADPEARSAPRCEKQTLYREELLPLVKAGYRARVSVEARFSDIGRELSDARNALAFLK